jgi:hypothetical protein
MGKKTLYHPVSTNVLRGALEYCGVTPGRIQQMSANRQTQSAVYRIYILHLPDGWLTSGLMEAVSMLQSCFATDVVIVSANFYIDVVDRREMISIELETHLYPNEPTEASIAAQQLQAEALRKMDGLE